jgi:hypothetical protein
MGLWTFAVHVHWTTVEYNNRVPWYQMRTMKLPRILCERKCCLRDGSLKGERGAAVFGRSSCTVLAHSEAPPPMGLACTCEVTVLGGGGRRRRGRGRRKGLGQNSSPPSCTFFSRGGRGARKGGGRGAFSFYARLSHLSSSQYIIRMYMYIYAYAYVYIYI